MQVPASAPAYRRITVRELAGRVATGTAPRIIDVREPYEWAIARLPGAELKPLSDIRRWHADINPAEEIVFHCHHGVRSATVCRVLAAEGFARLCTLTGGIDAWAVEIEPRMARY